jgi:hypothetical protein
MIGRIAGAASGLTLILAGTSYAAGPVAAGQTAAATPPTVYVANAPLSGKHRRDPHQGR